MTVPRDLPAKTSLLAMQGTVAGIPATILIDGGAAGNFVSKKFVENNSLQTRRGNQLTSVTLADGSKQ